MKVSTRTAQKTALINRVSSIKGFTLLEVMIVMAIVGLLMALVGPLTIKSHEKTQAKAELLTLQNWIRGNSYRAYATGKGGRFYPG